MFLLLWVLLLFLSGQQQPSALQVAAQGRAEQQRYATSIWHDLSPYPRACGTGEVISWGLEPADAFTRWMASPSHLAIITGQQWTSAAVGQSGGVLVVAFVVDCVTTGGQSP